MASGEIHKGDVGTVFRATLKDGSTVVDHSAATTRQIRFRKPDGDRVVKSASLPAGDDGSQGRLEYETTPGDLDQAGYWEWQARIIFADDTQWSSDVKTFQVHENL